MDNQILHLDSSEAVLFYGDLDHPEFDVFNDNNNDGKWQAGEQFTVLSSNLERNSNQYKVASMGYYEMAVTKKLLLAMNIISAWICPLMLD